jgi:uncharacterized membrane protein YsdA (DUF1294 family)
MALFIIYLTAINFVSGCTFALDKRAAIKGYRRIPERTLHLLELLGGVFAIWLLMYLLHHKNRKFSYYAVTYLLLIGWVAVLVLGIQRF